MFASIALLQENAASRRGGKTCNAVLIGIVFALLMASTPRSCAGSAWPRSVQGATISIAWQYMQPATARQNLWPLGLRHLSNPRMVIQSQVMKPAKAEQSWSRAPRVEPSFGLENKEAEQSSAQNAPLRDQGQAVNKGVVGPSVADETIDQVKIETVFISVADETGLEEVAKYFASSNVHILSTGDTVAQLRNLGCTVQDLAEYTSYPDIFGGRLKTLHPKLYSSLLTTRGFGLQENQASRAIDLVITNMHPFEQVAANNSDFHTCLDHIDIGGPALIRAAAKNCARVTIISSPTQYASLLDHLGKHGGYTNHNFRKALGVAAYAYTIAYDTAVNDWCARHVIDLPTTKPSADEGLRRYDRGLDDRAPHRTDPQNLDDVGRDQGHGERRYGGDNRGQDLTSRRNYDFKNHDQASYDRNQNGRALDRTNRRNFDVADREQGRRERRYWGDDDRGRDGRARDIPDRQRQYWGDDDRGRDRRARDHTDRERRYWGDDRRGQARHARDLTDRREFDFVSRNQPSYGRSQDRRSLDHTNRDQWHYGRGGRQPADIDRGWDGRSRDRSDHFNFWRSDHDDGGGSQYGRDDGDQYDRGYRGYRGYRGQPDQLEDTRRSDRQPDRFLDDHEYM